MSDYTLAIAHHRSHDNLDQSLYDHLTGVASHSCRHSKKIGLGEIGELMGLLHDLGKYSHTFQDYIRSAVGHIDPDADEWVDSRQQRGKIDHSTAGAQYLWQHWSRYGDIGRLAGQIVALCIASHHSGLIDCLKPSGEDSFRKRIDKDDSNTHLRTCITHADPALLQRIDMLCDTSQIKGFLARLETICAGKPPIQNDFYLGMVTRFLFSALIDGDRQDSSDFENPDNCNHRHKLRPDWLVAIGRLERALL